MNIEKQNELSELLVALQEKRITKQQATRLNWLIENDDEAVEICSEQFVIEAMLQWHFGLVGTEMAAENKSTKIIPFRPQKRIVMAVLSLAACLAIVVGVSFWLKLATGRQEESTHSVVKTISPTSAKFAEEWSIVPTGGAVYEIVSSTCVRLVAGEIFIKSISNGNKAVPSISVETASGTATADGTSFYIGTHKTQIETEKGNLEMNTEKIGRLTRVLVLSGVVTLSNALGTVTGTANELLSAKEGSKPAKEVVKSNSDFAINLYQELAKENPGKNLFFSPFSILSALAMTAEGARGETAREMGKVLCFPESTLRKGDDAQMIPWQTSVIHSGMGELNDIFNAKDKAYQLAVANALWIEKTFPLRPEFLAAMSPYGAGFFPADFKSAPDAERLRINKWVEEKTNNKIKDLISEGMITDITRLVLTNAIYFKGDWAKKFDKKLTKDADFTIADGSKKTVPMMAKTSKFSYAKLDGFAALEMPYKGDELSMVVLLPDKNDGLPALEKNLTSKNLNGWLEKLSKQKVDVKFPKFKSEQKFFLVQDNTLKNMGMKLALTYPGADFTGLSDSPEAKEIYIGEVIHQSFVQVDEEGTEAAAATAVVMQRGGSAAPHSPPSFIADHPFIYLIRDVRTGSILFLGRMMEPK